MDTDVRKILIYRIGQLGDTLVAMPAIKSIKKKYPDHELILLTDRHQSKDAYVSSWNILEPTGWFSEVIYYDIEGRKFEKLKKLVSLIAKLRVYNIDKAYILAPYRNRYQTIRDQLFFRYMASIRNVMAEKQIYLQQGKENIKSLQEWRRLLLITEHEDDEPFRLKIPEAYRNTAAEKLGRHGITTEKKLLAVAPGSKMTAKKWPIENYHRLGSKLLEKFSDIELVVIGGPEDASDGDYLIHTWGERAHNLAGKLSLYESAAVLEQCSMYIGNDSGAMHLASMVGVRCVALFSARDVKGKWEPFGEGHAILRQEVECKGCMLETCMNDNKCMANIRVDDVLAIVSTIVNSDCKS